MQYSIGELAALTGISPSTLRYYDKEGFFPDLNREQSGARIFTDREVGLLKIIECLKATGMSIKDIRQYIQLALQGDDTIDMRLNMFQHQRELLKAQLEEMRHTLEMVEYKCWYYETAKAAGTVEAPKNMAEDQIPDCFRHIRQELRTAPQKQAVSLPVTEHSEQRKA